MGMHGEEDCSSSCGVSSISVNEPLCQSSSFFNLSGITVFIFFLSLLEFTQREDNMSVTYIIG